MRRLIFVLSILAAWPAYADDERWYFVVTTKGEYCKQIGSDTDYGITPELFMALVEKGGAKVKRQPGPAGVRFYDVTSLNGSQLEVAFAQGRHWCEYLAEGVKKRNSGE